MRRLWHVIRPAHVNLAEKRLSRHHPSLRLASSVMDRTVRDVRLRSFRKPQQPSRHAFVGARTLLIWRHRHRLVPEERLQTQWIRRVRILAKRHV